MNPELTQIVSILQKGGGTTLDAAAFWSYKRTGHRMR